MILKNKRHEHFAQLMAQGKTQTEAAITAGYSEARARSQGCMLAKDEVVAKRIKQLTERTAERTVAATAISKAWVIEKLRENVARAMQAEPVRDSKSNATGEYTWNGNVANRALELIGRELGMFIEQKKIQLGKLSEATPEQLLELLNEIDGEIERTRTTQSQAVN